MKNLDLNKNYFELFGLEASQNIDLEQLQKQFQRLQAEYHPDKYSNTTDQQSRQAMQISSLLNEAFQTLKEPLGRATYILKLNGIDLDTETDTRMDPEFLMEQMETREEMENISETEEGLEKIDQLAARVQQQLQQLLAQVEQAIAAKNWQQAREILRKVQFINKIHLECKQIQEKIEDGLF